MIRKKFGIKETGTTFITGVVFNPSWDDVNAIIAKMYVMGLLERLVPDVQVSVVLAHRGAMRMTVPLILERAHMDKSVLIKQTSTFEVKAMLWVLACFWYMYGGGPHPAPARKIRYPRRGAVLEFRCPFCAQQYKPHPRWKNRKSILRQYGYWMVKHGVQCDKLLYLDRSVKL